MKEIKEYFMVFKLPSFAIKITPKYSIVQMHAPKFLYLSSNFILIVSKYIGHYTRPIIKLLNTPFRVFTIASIILSLAHVTVHGIRPFICSRMALDARYAYCTVKCARTKKKLSSFTTTVVRGVRQIIHGKLG